MESARKVPYLCVLVALLAAAVAADILRHNETCQCVKAALCRSGHSRLAAFKKTCPGPDEVCCYGGPHVSRRRRQLRDGADQCGVRVRDGTSEESEEDFEFEFKVTGTETDTSTVIGEFPWTLLLYYVETPVEDDLPEISHFLCGGSLILPRFALTAAHCFKGKDDAPLWVRAGEYDRSVDGETDTQDRSVQSMIIHEEYDEKAPRNDIALLFLDEPFELTDNIKLICLAESSVSYVGDSCQGVGWGLNGDGDDAQEQPQLRKALLPVLSKPQCETMLKNEIKRKGNPKKANKFRLDSGFMCAGGKKNVDLCKGDGGGPLICRAKEPPNRYVQVGITSWGLGCARENVPGVYTDVQEHKQWILDKISALE